MEWLIADWRQLMPRAWANVALTLVAVLCGLIVGLERERKEKPAGMLTLSLVCLGAAVFTMISYLFDGGQGDPSRIAAQVVTGVGFLGAGVILRGSGGITGTVTAATIWAIAAIGMLAGAGYAGPAIILSLLVFAVLMLVSWIEKYLIDLCGFTAVELVFDPAGGKTLLKIEEMLDVQGVHARPTDLLPTAEGLVKARLTYCHAHRHHREFLGRLAELPEIKEIHKDGRNHERKHQNWK